MRASCARPAATRSDRDHRSQLSPRTISSPDSAVARSPGRRLRFASVDGQRQYPTELERWYGEHPDDRARSGSGQRPGDRYPDESGGYAYGTPAPYAEPGYSDPAYAPADPAYAAADVAYPDQRYAEPGYDDAPAYRAGPTGTPAAAGAPPSRQTARCGRSRPGRVAGRARRHRRAAALPGGTSRSAGAPTSD